MSAGRTKKRIKQQEFTKRAAERRPFGLYGELESERQTEISPARGGPRSDLDSVYDKCRLSAPDLSGIATLSLENIRFLSPQRFQRQLLALIVSFRGGSNTTPSPSAA